MEVTDLNMLAPHFYPDPENVELTKDPREGGAEEKSFPCKILSETFMGNYRVYSVSVGDQTLVATRMSSEKLRGQVYLRISGSKVRLFSSPPPA